MLNKVSISKIKKLQDVGFIRRVRLDLCECLWQASVTFINVDRVVVVRSGASIDANMCIEEVWNQLKEGKVI